MVENRKGCVLGTRRCTPQTTAQEIHCQWRHDPAYTFEDLARMVGAQRPALSRKTDGFSEELSIRLFIAAAKTTGNLRPMASLARDLDGVFVPLPAGERSRDVYAALAAVMAEVGEDADVIQRVLADDHITPDEAVRVTREIDDTIARLVALRLTVEAQARPAAPATTPLRQVIA